MNSTFKYNLGKYKNYKTFFLSSLFKTTIAILVLLICLVIVVYSNGVPLHSAICRVCLIEFIILLPVFIFEFFKRCKTVVYEMHFDDKGLNIIYDYYFVKKTKYIVYDELSFSVKTMFSYYKQGTCIVLYERHKPFILITCRDGWNESLMIAVIKTLLEVKNNKMEKPLGKRLLSNSYFYTLGLERSGVAKRLVDISNTMKQVVHNSLSVKLWT